MISYEKYPITIVLVVVFVLIYGFSLYSYFTNPGTTALYAPDGTPIPSRYPPVLETCPPYWSKLASGECKKDFDNGLQKCDARDIALHLQYTEENPVVDLKNLTWVQRCKWAKKCGVKYDFNKPCIADAFEGYDQV